jgi:hypothetical protein
MDTKNLTKIYSSDSINIRTSDNNIIYLSFINSSFICNSNIPKKVRNAHIFENDEYLCDIDLILDYNEIYSEYKKWKLIQ